MTTNKVYSEERRLFNKLVTDFAESERCVGTNAVRHKRAYSRVYAVMYSVFGLNVRKHREKESDVLVAIIERKGWLPKAIFCVRALM